jgi:hypothetical protein
VGRVERTPGFPLPDDPEAATGWFSAWALFHDRELAGLFAPRDISGATGDPAEAAARSLRCSLKTRGLSQDVVRGRCALRAAAPTFFPQGLARVAR